jgi:hypothetical protein
MNRAFVWDGIEDDLSARTWPIVTTIVQDLGQSRSPRSPIRMQNGIVLVNDDTGSNLWPVSESSHLPDGSLSNHVRACQHRLENGFHAPETFLISRQSAADESLDAGCTNRDSRNPALKTWCDTLGVPAALRDAMIATLTTIFNLVVSWTQI